MIDVLPSKGEKWRHFKGTLYNIVGFTWDAENDELILRVLYQGVGTDESSPIFSRTLSNFIGPVDNRAKARFTKCTG